MTPMALPEDAQPAYTVLRERVKLRSAGFSYYPNWRLREARTQEHRLNLLLIGVPSVGKATLINTLFNTSLIPPFRKHDPAGSGADEISIATYSSVQEEAGIRLHVEVSEVLGVNSAAQFADDAFLEGVLRVVRDRHVQCYREEARTSRDASACFDALYSAVLYFIPPTFTHFLAGELRLIQSLQQMTLFVPIISKADMYTPAELAVQKETIRAQLQASALMLLPDILQGFTDPSLVGDFAKIAARWPLAVIGSGELVDSGRAPGLGGAVRARVYAWGVVDVDNEEHSDLHCLEILLIKFLKLNAHFVRSQIYEVIWRPSLLLGKEDALAGGEYVDYSPKEPPKQPFPSGRPENHKTTAAITPESLEEPEQREEDGLQLQDRDTAAKETAPLEKAALSQESLAPGERPSPNQIEGNSSRIKHAMLPLENRYGSESGSARLAKHPAQQIADPRRAGVL